MHILWGRLFHGSVSGRDPGYPAVNLPGVGAVSGHVPDGLAAVGNRLQRRHDAKAEERGRDASVRDALHELGAENLEERHVDEDSGRQALQYAVRHVHRKTASLRLHQRRADSAAYRRHERVQYGDNGDRATRLMTNQLHAHAEGDHHFVSDNRDQQVPHALHRRLQSQRHALEDRVQRQRQHENDGARHSSFFLLAGSFLILLCGGGGERVVGRPLTTTTGGAHVRVVSRAIPGGPRRSPRPRAAVVAVPSSRGPAPRITPTRPWPMTSRAAYPVSGWQWIPAAVYLRVDVDDHCHVRPVGVEYRVGVRHPHERHRVGPRLPPAAAAQTHYDDLHQEDQEEAGADYQLGDRVGDRVPVHQRLLQ